MPFFSLLIFVSFSSAQTKNVNVNLSTGTAFVSIPVYTVSRGGVSVPVSLEYAAKGLKVGDIQSVVGSGWQLNAGGAITREVRDLPDDIKADNSSNSRMGWLYNTNATKFNSFAISNDNNPATCTDENSDITYINTNFADNSDMEPDIFDVEAPGLSCQLVYDQINGIFRTIPYKDLQISYTLNGSLNSIASFTIVNDKGVIYTFNVTEPLTQTTSSSAPGSILYFKRKYSLYQNGITYNSKWYLSKIQDPSGNYIALTYSNTIISRNVSSPTQMTYGGTGVTRTDVTLYNTAQVYNPQCITGIYAYNPLNSNLVDGLAFGYTSTPDPGGALINTFGFNSGRVLNLFYTTATGRTRNFLSAFGELGCSAGGAFFNPNLYSFTYTTIPGVSIPDFTTFAGFQDYWGYLDLQSEDLDPTIYVYPDNPSFPNLERYRLFPVSGYTGTTYTLSGGIKTVDPSITTGTLSQITYPTGGTTSLILEPNDFYDVNAAAAFQGGGLRVKQIIDYDGINAANNITRNYTYTDPSTSITTGKPVSLPVVGFTVPYTGTATGSDYWNFSTVRLPPGYSNQDESIIYGKVTVQQTGAGKVVYEYSTPATNWDASASPDWAPTLVNAGRLLSGSCPAIGSLKNATNTYPFIPNINYDFERGLPTRVTTYNESGAVVSQSTYAYQRSYSTPVAITGLKFDNNSTAEGYAKYQVYASTSELVSTETKFVNDLANSTNDPARRAATTTNYYYAGANHKLPTKIETVNTDGTTDRAYIKYTKDYTFAFDDVYDQPMGAIKALVGLNVNIPIEQYYTVTRASVENTIRAELVKFGSFASGQVSPSNLYLPAQRLKFLSSAGTTGFTPSFNNAGTFSSYSGYFPTANFTAYNYGGALLSGNDNYNNIRSQLVDDNLLMSVANVSGANYNEISYSNFDGAEPKYGVTVSGATYNNTISRSGSYCLSFPSTGLLTDSLNLKPNTKNYVYSCWINAASAGTLTISLYNSAGTFFGSQTISFAASGTGWNYYEKKLSTNGLSSSFSIRTQTNATVNIDDILFYPENTEVSTYSYDPKIFYKTSETNTNGVAKYYSYDPYYRLQYVYDQDRNIVLKKTYAFANEATALGAATSFTISPGSVTIGASATFTGTSPGGACLTGNYYSWDFGDGTGTGPSLTNSNPSHSYTAAGIYTVTFTVSNSIFTKSYTQNISVTVIPYSCQSGVYAYAAPTIFTQTCSGEPSDNSHSYFTIQSLSGAPSGHVFSYQWQIYYPIAGSNCGAQSWTNTGTNAAQLIMPFSASTFCPYEIRCIITDTNSGQQVTWNVGDVSASQN